jgi:hypothetical protein
MSVFWRHFFSSGSTAPSGLGPSHYWGFTITFWRHSAIKYGYHCILFCYKLLLLRIQIENKFAEHFFIVWSLVKKNKSIKWHKASNDQMCVPRAVVCIQLVFRVPSVWIVPFTEKYMMRIYTAFMSQLQLWHLHRLVPVQSVGDLHSQVASLLHFMSHGDATAVVGTH